MSYLKVLCSTKVGCMGKLLDLSFVPHMHIIHEYMSIRYMCRCGRLSMRTTILLDDALLKQAQELTQIKEKTALLHEGLRALISQASRERLIALGGTQKSARAPRRKR